MKCLIEGNYPMLRCRLDRGETIKTSAGSMSWMSDGFDLKVESGGFGKGLSRMFSGESMFLNYYTARKDNQEIVFASSLPGEIKHIKMEGQTLIGQKTAYLASSMDVDFKTVFTKKISTGLLGGEGFILQQFSGYGDLFLEADGSLVEYDLGSGEAILVDQGHVFLFEERVSYEIETIKGMKNIFFGGEGMFLVRLVGPGKVLLQSMPISNLAAKIIPYVPSNG